MSQADMFPEMPQRQKRERTCKHPHKCLHEYCLNKSCPTYRECIQCKRNAEMLLRQLWK